MSPFNYTGFEHRLASPGEGAESLSQLPACKAFIYSSIHAQWQRCGSRINTLLSRPPLSVATPPLRALTPASLASLPNLTLMQSEGPLELFRRLSSAPPAFAQLQARTPLPRLPPFPRRHDAGMQGCRPSLRQSRRSKKTPRLCAVVS